MAQVFIQAIHIKGAWPQGMATGSPETIRPSMTGTNHRAMARDPEIIIKIGDPDRFAMHSDGE